MTTPPQLTFDVDIAALRESGILVMSPLYGGVNYGPYTKSLLELGVMCNYYGIPFNVHFIYNESLVQRARNMCCDVFLRSERQLGMFIDSDIEFRAQDVLIMGHLMLKNNFDVLTGAYPKKAISWEKIRDAVFMGVADEDPSVLERYVGDYVVNWLNDGKTNLLEPVEIAEGGTGFMMFHRNTLERFKEAYPEMQYRPDHARSADFDGSRMIHAFFHCEIDPETRRYLSEDYYFCRKVRDAGMKVWLAPWIALKHTGTYTFGGSLLDLAAINANTSADPAKVKNTK